MWFSALIPVKAIPERVKDASWDFSVTDGSPSIWTYYKKGGASKKSVYYPFGNEKGIEPLVIWREFHGIRDDFPEVSQEFRLYHNLYPEPSRKRLLRFDRDGNESEVIRYGDDLVEIRADLVLSFCAVKQMALGIFVDSNRQSAKTLDELGVAEIRTPESGSTFVFNAAVVPDTFSMKREFKSLGRLLGKKYILPGPMVPENEGATSETYQEFIIGTEPSGKSVKYTSDPGKLADYFGKNPDAPHYFTPVFFRTEVLSKYYADPQKYSVEDGYLRCGSLWGLKLDNDNPDYIVVWLGDLGRDLSYRERNYWLNFNIPPEGRKISQTNFQRAFLAQPTDPKKPDLVFKYELERFREEFRRANGWDFIRQLHTDDEHFLTGLRLLSKDNQAEFDSQLIAFTKILVDSIHENEISKGLTTLAKDDKGITKLEKFFKQRGLTGFEPHIKFLRVLQDLRSKSAAHRKGSNYEKLIEQLQLADEGQQKVFGKLATAAVELVRYLRANLIPDVPA